MRYGIALLVALGLPSLASAQMISYTLVVTDLADTPVSRVEAGDPFKLRVFVADVRPSPQGVFAAFIDVTFDSALASTNGAIVHLQPYSSSTSGTSSPGLLDEVGGFDGLSPLGAGMFPVFEQALTATADGCLTFVSDPADISPVHDNLVYGSSTAVSPADIAFGTAALSIAESLADIFADGFECGETAAWSSVVP